MRLLVCGGRTFADRRLVAAVLNPIRRRNKIELVIHGGASGADSLGAEWASVWRLILRRYEADWTTHGKAAGPIRNQLMLDDGKPDLVVAFAGGRGTADMVRRAAAAGVPVIEVDDYEV